MSGKKRFTIAILIAVLVLLVSAYLYSTYVFAPGRDMQEQNEPGQEQLIDPAPEDPSVQEVEDARKWTTYTLNNISLEYPDGWREKAGELRSEGQWLSFRDADTYGLTLADYLKEELSYRTYPDGTKELRETEFLSEDAIIISGSGGYYVRAMVKYPEGKYFQALYGVEISGTVYIFDYTSEPGSYENNLADVEKMIKSVKITPIPGAPKIILTDVETGGQIRNGATISKARTYQLSATSGNESMSNIVIEAPDGSKVSDSKALETTPILAAEGFSIAGYADGYYKVTATDVDGSTSIFYFTVSE